MTFLKRALSLMCIGGAAMVAAGTASAQTIPESSALVSIPAIDAANCTKKYMVSRKAYYVAADDGTKLVFERPTINPYSSIFRPYTSVYERVHVRFEQVADTTRILTYYQIIVDRNKKVGPSTTITEYGHPDMKLSHERAIRIAKWIKKQPSTSNCY